MLQNQRYVLALIAGLLLCRTVSITADESSTSTSTPNPCSILMHLLEEVSYTMDESTKQIDESISNSRLLGVSLDCFYNKWLNNLNVISTNEQQLVAAYQKELSACCKSKKQCEIQYKKCQTDYQQCQDDYQKCADELQKCHDEYNLLAYMSDSCAKDAAEKIVELTARYKDLAGKRAELSCRLNALLSAKLLQDNEGVDKLINDLNTTIIAQRENAVGCAGDNSFIDQGDVTGTLTDGECSPEMLANSKDDAQPQCSQN